MGIRETLNEKPAIVTGATAGVIIIAVGFMVWWTMHDRVPKGGSSQAYFTVDDGATYFPDDASKRAPFDKDGKMAVRCYVFSCDQQKHKFVGYLQRYPLDVKKQLDALAAKQNKTPEETATQMDLTLRGLEVKAPLTGDKGWVKEIDTPNSSKITEFDCQGGGKREDLEPVTP